MALFDAAGNALLPAAAALADGVALPTTTKVGAALYAYDGSVLRLVRTADPTGSPMATGLTPAVGYVWFGSGDLRPIQAAGATTDGWAAGAAPISGLILRNGAGTHDVARTAAGIASGKGQAATLFGATGTTPLLPDPAATAAGMAYPTTTVVRTVPMLDNGATLDPQQGNVTATLLASAARTTTTDSATQTNKNGRGVLLRLEGTANPGGGQTLSLAVVEAIGTVTRTLYATTASAFGGAGTFSIILNVYPSATTAPTGGTVHESASMQVPKLWFAEVNHSGAGSWTYDLKVSVGV